MDKTYWKNLMDKNLMDKDTYDNYMSYIDGRRRAAAKPNKNPLKLSWWGRGGLFHSWRAMFDAWVFVQNRK